MEASEELAQRYPAVHAAFGPVFLSHMVSDAVSDRKNILKLLQEWVVDEATELPDGLVVVRTAKVPLAKVDVLRAVVDVCVRVFGDPEEEVFQQGCHFLKAVLASTKVVGRVKHTDVSAELRPAVAALGARLGDPLGAVRHRAMGLLLTVCRRGPSTVYVSLVFNALAAWPAPDQPAQALGALYGLAMLTQTFGLKGRARSAPLEGREEPGPPSPAGLVPLDRLVAFLGSCLARGQRELLQPCYRVLCDLQRLATSAQLEPLLAKVEEPYQSDARRILQHSPNLSAFDDARGHFAGPAGNSPRGSVASGRQKSVGEVDDDDLLAFVPGRITKDLLTSASKLARGRDEPLSHYLDRVLTLTLEGKGIDAIDNLHHCPNLKVLYLYDNQLTQVRNLEFARHLTHLYLNNNQLTTLDGLQALRSLKKLYLNYNRIGHLDTIGSLTSLQELYMSHQKLDPGQGLVLDGATLYGLQRLEVLALAANGLADVAEVRQLGAVQQLDVSDNRIASLEALRVVLQQCRRLRELQLHGNPLAVGKYVDDIVLYSGPSLCTVDNRTITPKEREFLLQLKARRTSLKGAPTGSHPAPTPPLPPVQGSEVGRPRPQAAV